MKKLLTILMVMTAGMSFAQQDSVFLVVLGTVQDAGSPHAGCERECCADLFENPDPTRKVVSLGMVDMRNQKTYLFEASPDLPVQMKILKKHAPFQETETPDGIFVSHAHIGHYAGLMYLGRESMSSDKVPVYCMKRMKFFLERNGPWNQLIDIDNIRPMRLEPDSIMSLEDDISVQPILVPHRDEYSETVGFIVNGPNKRVLIIPDIDKWSVWERNVTQLIKEVDVAFVDATFYDGTEVPGRNMEEIPHPFVIESMALFMALPPEEKKKINFIHLNHTNPLLNPYSDAYRHVIEEGFKIAFYEQKVGL